MKRHRWTDKGAGLKDCRDCGATKRGRGQKLQFILPYRKDGKGRPLGWTPLASYTPPCVGAAR